MTTWVKCSECDYANLSVEPFKCHLKNQHYITIKRGNDAIQEFIVKDQQEIEDLKKRKTCDKIRIGNLSEIQSEIQFKDDIEIEEHFVENDDNDTFTKNDESVAAGLSELDKEWLILGP